MVKIQVDAVKLHMNAVAATCDVFVVEWLMGVPDEMNNELGSDSPFRCRE